MYWPLTFCSGASYVPAYELCSLSLFYARKKTCASPCTKLCSLSSLHAHTSLTRRFVRTKQARLTLRRPGPSNVMMSTRTDMSKTMSPTVTVNTVSPRAQHQQFQQQPYSPGANGDARMLSLPLTNGTGMGGDSSTASVRAQRGPQGGMVMC
jgi:hypothetical protein